MSDPKATVPSRRRSGYVVRVARRSVTADFPVYPCASVLSVLHLFKYQHHTAFADDKTGAFCIERPASLLGLVVEFGGNGLHILEACHSQGNQRGFRSPRKHDIRHAHLDVLVRQPHRMIGARACAYYRMVRTLEAFAYRDESRRYVRNRVG